jgi:hypothetical protein
VSQPTANQKVTLNVPFAVTGQVSDLKGVEPHTIDSVTVQVDGGAPVRALLKVLVNPQTLVSFTAMVTVTGGADPHTVTIVATDDAELSATKTVSVFTGATFPVDAPAIILDQISAMAADPTDPKVLALMGTLAQKLEPLATSLGSIGKVLIGPNLVTAATANGVPVLRMGLWIENAGFPTQVAPTAEFPLARLSDVAAAAGFRGVAVLPVPPASTSGPSFALSVSVTALQRLLDAVMPSLQSAASDQHVTLQSVSVRTQTPASVVTDINGSLPLGVGLTITITETLGVAPLANANPAQSVPVVTGSSESSSVGSLLDWVLGAFIPYFGDALIAASGAVALGAGDLQNKITGEASLVSLIPARIPLRNTDVPVPANLLPLLPDFPALVLDWRSFAVTDSAIVGTGVSSLVGRVETDVAMVVDGSGFISGLQVDLAGAAAQTYNVGLTNIAPDPGKFTWQAVGALSRSGTIDLGSMGEGGDFGVYFPLPAKVQPGNYPFTLNVNAAETCGSDASKTLTAASSMAVRVQVKKNPKVLP